MGEDERRWVKFYDKGVTSEIVIPSMNYIDLLERAFSDFSRKTACWYFGQSLSFSDLDRYSQSFAAFLLQNGCKPGEVVAICLPNIPQFLIGNIGAIRAGCLPTGLSPLLSAKEMAFQLQHSGAKVLVTLYTIVEEKISKIVHQTPSLRFVLSCNADDRSTGNGSVSNNRQESTGKGFLNFADLLQVYKPTRPHYDAGVDENCLLQYTGGTTGVPKGALLTHRNILANILQCNQWLKIERGSEVYLSAFPFYHLAGLALGLTALCMGHSQIIIPNPRDTQHICNEIASHRPTIMAFVPTLYHMLLQDPRFKVLDFSSCRIFKSGAAPFAPELMKEAAAVVGDGKIVEVYGLTETFILTMNPYQGRKKVGRVGIPLQSTDVKIVDLETGKHEVPFGTEGELIARGPQIMERYYKDREGTGSAFREFKGEMWIFTGDVARMDDEGYITVVDRVKDMIIVGGYKVFSKEVEDILYEHPAVSFCAVVGGADSESPGGEIVRAVIQSKKEYDPYDHQTLKAELTSHCRENLAAYKVPKIIDFVKNMPLTVVGKVDKKSL